MELLYDMNLCADLLVLASTIALALCAMFDWPEQNGKSPRHIYVRTGAPEGGSGDIDHPCSSISEAVRLHGVDRGCVYLFPGVYEEQVTIDTGTFWLMPATQQRVTIAGHITVRVPSIKLCGLDIAGGLTLTTGATDCDIQLCRLTGPGPSGACIELTGADITGCSISGNVIDCRHCADRPVGLRIDVQNGDCENRIDHNQITGCRCAIDIRSAGSTGTPPIISANRMLANSTGIAVHAPRVRVTGNTIEESSDVAIELSAVSAIVESNFIMRNANGINIEAPGATLRNNVIADCARTAVTVQSGAPEIFHNTFHSPADNQAPLFRVHKSARAYARYNIFSSPGTLVEAAGEFSAQWNLFTHATEYAGEPCMIGDPQFADAASGDFTLLAQSPAAGAVPGTPVERDFRGGGRLGHIRQSIGAFEAPVDRGDNTRIYVAPDAGSEEGFGTESRPYGDIQYAIEQALPGDEVILKPGVYRPGLIHVSCAGAPDAPIVIRSEVPHAAAIRDSSIIFDECAHVRLEGVHIADSVGDALTLSNYVQNCQFINNLIAREEGEGGHAVVINGPGCCDNLFERNTIRLNHDGCGIIIASHRHNHRMTLRHNDISGCHCAVRLGAGSCSVAAPGFHIIENNELHHNTRQACCCAASDNLLRANDIHHNEAGGVAVRCGSRNVILDNRIHHNTTAGVQLHSRGHFVLNNMIYANAGDGILASAWPGQHAEAPCETAGDIWIAGNTVARNNDAPVCAEEGCELAVLRNIFVGSDPQAAGINVASADAVQMACANLYHNCRRLLLREHRGGFTEREADPLFIDPEAADLRPADESPAYRMAAAADALSFLIAALPGAYAPGEHVGSHLPPPEV